MSQDDIETRVAKTEKETDELLAKIKSFDPQNDSVDTLLEYQKQLTDLRQRTDDLLVDIEIEELLETVNQSLIDEGYITYEEEQ